MQQRRRHLLPVFKWPGGKRRLLSDIIALLPEKYVGYFEPFLGGGALFFSLSPRKAVLGDTNEELVNFYKSLVDDSHEIARRLKLMRNCPDTYYRVRASRPKSAVGAAVRFLYLRRTCFNGLYRANRGGDFNVPFGNNGRDMVGDIENMTGVVRALRNADIYCQDFEETCRMACKGDLVYMDPPYTVTHENNNFIEYNARIFTWQDQIRLRDLVLGLTSKGVKVVVSNAAHRTVEELYRGFKIHTVTRSSVLAAKNSARRKINEFIIVNY
jgi:DNA adenine methylase